MSDVQETLSEMAKDLHEVGGTIIGSLVGAWMGYRLSISLADIQAKHNGVLKLREILGQSKLTIFTPH